MRRHPERSQAIRRRGSGRAPLRGREVDTAGDGVLTRFDGPARAVSCACTIRDGVQGLGLEIRAGLHTGEIEGRAYRRPRGRVRRCSRSARLANRQGPRLGIRIPVRRPWGSRAQGRPRCMAALRGRRKNTVAATQSSWVIDPSRCVDIRWNVADTSLAVVGEPASWKSRAGRTTRQPMRLAAPAEITKIILRSAQASA